MSDGDEIKRDHVAVWVIASCCPEDFDYVGTEPEAEAIRIATRNSHKVRAGELSLTMALTYVKGGPFYVHEMLTGSKT